MPIKLFVSLRACVKCGIASAVCWSAFRALSKACTVCNRDVCAALMSGHLPSAEICRNKKHLFHLIPSWPITMGFFKSLLQILLVL